MGMKLLRLKAVDEMRPVSRVACKSLVSTAFWQAYDLICGASRSVLRIAFFKLHRSYNWAERGDRSAAGVNFC